MKRRSSGFAWFILSGIAAVVVVPAGSYAATLPAAIFSVNAAGGTGILTAGTVSGTGSNGGSTGGSESSTATASYGSDGAAVSGSGSTSGGTSTADSSANATVTYYLEVIPIGSVSEPVPLIFSATGLTSASGPNAEALAYFETPGGGLYACSATGGAVGTCGAEPSSYSSSIDYSVSPNVPYDVEVLASGSSSLGSGSWSASVDPQVVIDPTFADAADFTLEFSPVTTTPLPVALPLFGAGLSVIGLLGWRRKRKNAAVIAA